MKLTPDPHSLAIEMIQKSIEGHVNESLELKRSRKDTINTIDRTTIQRNYILQIIKSKENVVNYKITSLRDSLRTLLISQKRIIVERKKNDEKGTD